MNQLTPEQLKVVAEGMGKDVQLERDGKLVRIRKHPLAEATNIYYPYIDPSQIVEVIKYYKIGMDFDEDSQMWRSTQHGTNIKFYSKSYEHAALTAAWEVAKEMKGER